MTYSVRVAAQPQWYIEQLDRQTQARIAERLRVLADDPFDVNHSKQLKNADRLRSSRVGSLRILFTADRDEMVVVVEKIAPRGQVYRRL